ncbi:MAG: HAD hydrolase-like protein [Proteobacteria bacterium]|nr:HAD hydrolase-like protein [Pseudomonadota bacterium]
MKSVLHGGQSVTAFPVENAPDRPVLQLAEVMDTYHRSSPWYPQKTGQGQGQWVASLADVAAGFDLILLDSYGVLSRGDGPIPQAHGAMDHLRAIGKPFRIVSNDTTALGSRILPKYVSRGFNFKQGEVVTSLDAVHTFFSGRDDLDSWAMLGAVNSPLPEVTSAMEDLVATDGEVSARVKNILFLIGMEWHISLQKKLEASAQGRQFGVAMGNPDIAAPVHDRLMATPGYYAERFMRTTGQSAAPIVLGKPGNAVFAEALKGYEGIDPARILMVGDTLHTDILGGNAMGFKTLLVESGIFTGQDTAAWIQKTGIVPDFVSPTI